jgi:hypothetical protein
MAVMTYDPQPDPEFATQFDFHTNLAKECNLLRLQVLVLIEPIQCKIT